MDMAYICDWSELNLKHGANGRTIKPKASSGLSLGKRKGVYKWVQSRTMPDTYCCTIENCVDIKSVKFQNMQSYDCHVFLHTFMLTTFCSLPNDVLELLGELSEQFRSLCSTELRVNKLQEMQRGISIILCRMERVFPLGFFNAMEHLPIHLVEEAYLCSLVQY